MDKEMDSLYKTIAIPCTEKLNISHISRITKINYPLILLGIKRIIETKKWIIIH